MPTTYFQDNIERFIPVMYQTGEFDGTVEFFRTVVAPLLDDLYQRIIDLPKLSDVDKCPPQFLQLLAGNINTLTVEDTFNENQTVAFRRRELGKMVDLFQLRSTPKSFLRILKYLGATDYGLIIPRKNMMLLGVTPIGGSPDDETNDVGELLAPQYFDISELADGEYDDHGNLLGNRISYAIPARIVRSEVRLYWNDHEVTLSHEHPEGEWERSFYFNRHNTTLTTNFVPLLGDSVVVEVVGDPYYRQSYRMPDRKYWRPGTAEVWSDVNPLLRFAALMDRRPIGTMLYFVWIAKFFQTKCFPFPPAIDYQRVGYAPALPPHEAASWNPLNDCNLPDPWYFQISSAYGLGSAWEARGDEQLSKQHPYAAQWREDGLLDLESLTTSTTTTTTTTSTTTIIPLLLDGNLAIVFDTSPSMSDQDLVNEKNACKQLVDGLSPLNGPGGITVWSFSLVPIQRIIVSHNPVAIKAAIDPATLNSYTALFNAIISAVNSDQLKYMVVMGDGDDNDPSTDITRQQVIDACVAAGVTVHTILFGTLTVPDTMQAIAAGTGGTYHGTSDSEGLTEIINTLLGR